MSKGPKKIEQEDGGGGSKPLRMLYHVSEGARMRCQPQAVHEASLQQCSFSSGAVRWTKGCNGLHVEIFLTGMISVRRLGGREYHFFHIFPLSLVVQVCVCTWQYTSACEFATVPVYFSWLVHFF